MTGNPIGFAPRSTKPARACMGLPLLLAALALWSCSVAAREPSLMCIYQMLTYAHEGVAYCGVPIDDDHKAKYEEARASLKRFINKNARSDRHKVSSELDDSARAHWRGKQRAHLCQSLEYSELKRFLTEALSADEIVKLRKRLETPGDPVEGWCLL